MWNTTFSEIVFVDSDQLALHEHGANAWKSGGLCFSVESARSARSHGGFRSRRHQCEHLWKRLQKGRGDPEDLECCFLFQ